MFDVRPPALVLAAFKMTPLRLHSDIVLQFRVGFREADAKSPEYLEHLRDQDSIQAAPLEVLADRHQHQVHTIILVERAHDV